jgi:hypothetical protein
LIHRWNAWVLNRLIFLMLSMYQQLWPVQHNSVFFHLHFATKHFHWFFWMQLANGSDKDQHNLNEVLLNCHVKPIQHLRVHDAKKQSKINFPKKIFFCFSLDSIILWRWINLLVWFFLDFVRVLHVYHYQVHFHSDKSMHHQLNDNHYLK